MNKDNNNQSGRTRSGKTPSTKYTLEDTIKYFNANFHTKSTVVNLKSFKELTEDEKSEILKNLPDRPNLSQLTAENVVYTTNLRKAMIILISIRPQLPGRVQLTSEHLISGCFEDFGDIAITLPSMFLNMSDRFKIANGGYSFLRSSQVNQSVSVGIIKALNTSYSSWKNKDKSDLTTFVATFLLREAPKKSNKISVKGETKVVRRKRINFKPDYFEENVNDIQNCWYYNSQQNKFQLYEISSSTLVEERTTLNGINYGCVDFNTILVLNSDSNLDEDLTWEVLNLTEKVPVALKGFTYGTYARNSLILLKKCFGIVHKILSQNKIKALIKTQCLMYMRQHIKETNLGGSKLSDKAVIDLLQNSDHRLENVAKKLSAKWQDDYVSNTTDDVEEKESEETAPASEETPDEKDED